MKFKAYINDICNKINDLGEGIKIMRLEEYLNEKKPNKVIQMSKRDLLKIAPFLEKFLSKEGMDVQVPMKKAEIKKMLNKYEKML